eukprot:131988-Rhodomonas_salina.1
MQVRLPARHLQGLQGKAPSCCRLLFSNHLLSARVSSISHAHAPPLTRIRAALPGDGVLHVRGRVQVHARPRRLQSWLGARPRLGGGAAEEEDGRCARGDGGRA